MTDPHNRGLNKEELAQLLRDFPNWGYAAIYYKHELERVTEELKDVCDVAIWLSANIPDEAQETWQTKMRPKLHAALATIPPAQESHV